MQFDLFGDIIAPTNRSKVNRSGAFTDNMKLPLHGWFRYSAGFSGDWVEQIVSKYSASASDPVKVLDPFCGSGTSLVAAAKYGAHSVGFEAHPFIAQVARAKTDWTVNIADFVEKSATVLRIAIANTTETPQSKNTLLLKCYTTQNLAALEALREAYFATAGLDGNRSEDRLIWLAITAILRECSGVGTAQWQYVLPNKTKARVRDPFNAFKSRVALFASDLNLVRSTLSGTSSIIETDARNPNCEEQFDLIITSPPYPNNYDYADATRLEMTFWGEVESWSDLHLAVRQFLIRSCSQHSAAEHLLLSDLLKNPAIAPIREELSVVCHRLEEERLTRAGRKTYHTMIAAYFIDLAKVWIALRPLAKSGAKIAFVIGDSAPYGVYAPCDIWLMRLAEEAGFHDCSFEKLRDRNIKWKNRKHTVPLKEGILHASG